MDRETRFIIWNQLEILKKLEPSEADDIELQQEIIAAGYTTQYDDVMPSIRDNEASEDMQREVMDTLDMFRALNHAKSNGWTPSNPALSKFRGYDGNNDPHYFFAQYLLDMRKKWAESAPNLNSHSSATIEKYRAMLKVWKVAANKFSLTPVEAETIITAK